MISSVSDQIVLESSIGDLESPFEDILNNAREQLRKIKSMQAIDFNAALLTAPKTAGIYIFLNDEKPIYVGRTRGIRGRLKGHVSATVAASTYAFLLAREATGLKPTYKAKGSRIDLLKNNPEFKRAFHESIATIKKMKVKYVEVEDDNFQYFLEFFCAVELQATHNKFRTT